VTIGLVAGFGSSAAYVVGILSVERWLDSRKTLGIGIVSAGTGFGTFIFPPIMQILLERFGWRATMFFLAGLAVGMSVVGMFVTEPKFGDVESGKRKSSNNRVNQTNWREKLKRAVSHFANVNFDLLALSTFVVYALYNVPIYFMVELLKTKGYTEAASAIYISVIGASLMVGMVTLGYVGDISGNNIKNVHALCTLVCGGSIAFIPWAAGSVVGLGVFCATFSFSFASAYVLIPKIAELIVGVEEFPSALGLNFSMQGLGCLVGTPFASVLFEFFDR
jgi:MFS family permease